MDDEKKKKIMIGLIVGCLSLVIIINVVLRMGKGGGSRAKYDKTTWMKCDTCEAEYEMDTKDYFAFVRENSMPMGPMSQTPAMACQECDEEGAFKAYYCKDCSIAFFPEEAGDGGYPDECPECGISQMQEKMANN